MKITHRYRVAHKTRYGCLYVLSVVLSRIYGSSFIDICYFKIQLLLRGLLFLTYIGPIVGYEGYWQRLTVSV